MPAKSKTGLTANAILIAAKERRNGAVLPLPGDTDPASSKATKLIDRLLARGLIKERPTTSKEPVWRSDDTEKHWSLRITNAGREAAEKACDSPTTQAATSTQISSGVDGTTPQPRGKLGNVLSAVQQPEGASIDELIELTGWQAHTVRASLSRPRQSGTPILLTELTNGKRYLATPAVQGDVQ